MIKVAPSLLSADFLNLGAEIDRMARAGADYLHFDVMDGCFVPNLSFGLPVLEAAAKGPLPVDVHLMIDRPERYVRDFARAGARIVTVHAEATAHLRRAFDLIRQEGCLAGVALNPGTPLSCVEYVLDAADLVLVMTVNPGFGGQKLIAACVRKIADMRALLDRAGSPAILEVDGGVSERTAPQLTEAGATMLVAGSALFGAPDAAAFIRAVKAG